MLPPLLDKTRPHPADKWLWALLGFMVVGQLAAFWTLCRDQVHKAEVREAYVRSARAPADAKLVSALAPSRNGSVR